MNKHFCFSELLILREKRFADFLLGHWSTKKKYKFSKNIEKPLYRRVAQKRYNFAPGAANHTFFYSPLTVFTKRVCVCNKELVCKAMQMAFSCQTSAISLLFILIPWVIIINRAKEV